MATRMSACLKAGGRIHAVTRDRNDLALRLQVHLNLQLLGRRGSCEDYLFVGRQHSHFSSVSLRSSEPVTTTAWISGSSGCRAFTGTQRLAATSCRVGRVMIFTFRAMALPVQADRTSDTYSTLPNGP